MFIYKIFQSITLEMLLRSKNCENFPNLDIKKAVVVKPKISLFLEKIIISNIVVFN